MSTRWKYIIVVHSAILTAATLFLYFPRLVQHSPTGFVHYVWAGGIVLILSLLLLAAYRMFVAKPLQRILKGAERLAKGDLDHRIELEGDDEFGGLGRSLNQMAEQVAQAESELEDQVRERTNDLRAVLEEVHERSRIVEEVNRQLAEVDRQRSEFLTNVSHELRTPLNSILGFLRLLIDRMYESEDERREFLENARQSASHLLTLVTDVLSSTQVEAGRMTVDIRPVHAGDVIREVLAVMDFQAREREVRLRMEVGGAAVLMADPPKLRQILINLVANAIRYTEKGEVVVRSRPCNQRLCIDVADTGAGIPPAELEKIFEKFHQVDTPTRRAHGGTGLGLWIAREMVELMEGKLDAKSDGPGRGATFTVSLPAAEAVSEAHRAAAASRE